MTIFVCTTCGTSYPDAAAAPDACGCCEDERQYVPPTGQSWMPAESLAIRHRNAWRRHEPGLFSIQTVPAFAIDQRAFLVCTPHGNVLWDCIALVDEATTALVSAMGGLAAIAISHPHYYTRMQDWSRAFGGIPIYLHGADREWVMRPDPAIVHWEDETREILPGVTLIRAGGHFPGGTVLHWGAGAVGAGVLLSGDIVQVSADVGQVSFMLSYPNNLPLPAGEVMRIGERLRPWPMARIYGAFLGREVLADGAGVLARSVERYVAALREP